jgi:tyrosine-protein kinase Etk/Wzc
MPNSMQGPEAPRAPAAADAEGARNVVRPVADRSAGERRAYARTSYDVTIGDIARTLVDGRWTVIALTAAALALAGLYLVVTTPTYDSSILIQVEGQSRPVSAFQDLAALFQEATPTEGEMRILRSRTLLGAVVADLDLDIETRPRTFSFLGEAIARRHRGSEPAPAPFGLRRYAWGGERLRVERVTVSDALLNEKLTLTALEGGRYRIAAADGAALAEGVVAKEAKGAAGDRTVELLVSELVARPGTEFTVVRRRSIDVIEGLQRGLRIAEQGRTTGLVEIALSGSDASRIAAILDAVAATYLRQSVERTSAEAAKTLRVLEGQLPVLKANLEKSERALNAFHRKNGTVNLSAEGQAMLQRLVEIERAIGENDVAHAELARRFTAGHPEVPVIGEKIRRLEEQRTVVEKRLRALPDLELEETRLSRQMRVATELYLLVLNRAEELRIVKSGWIGNVRVLERAAVPSHPASPMRGLVLTLGLLLGLGSGVAAVLLRDSMGRGVKDPDEIESEVGLAVLATIPRSAAQRKLARRARRGTVLPLAIAEPLDTAVEDLRGLRTSVQYALRQSRNNVVGVTGLAPCAGKSFVSVNLAHLLAAADRRVLLVDGDLRRGGLHRQFGVEGEPGLADLLGGKAELDAAVRSSGTRGLDVLPAGTLVPNPAELLAGDRLQQVLTELGRRYEVVIVDTPPVLSVADSALVGRHAGVNLLVLRAGEHTTREISTALNRLVQGGVVVRGAVLNEVRPSLGRRRAWYREYYAGMTH